MNFLYLFLVFVSIGGVALTLGRLNYEKNPVRYVVGWIAGLLLLIIIRFWDGHPFLVAALTLAALIHFLEKTPTWIFYAVGIGLPGGLCWYFFNLMGNAFIELVWEIKEINSRITRLENSLGAKLDDIGRQFPEEE